jgi:hypothetical protein
MGGVGAACTYAASILQGKFDGETDDPPLRLKLNRKGCDLGDLRSCSRLATQYDKGEVVPKDPKKAISLWSDACEKGYASSCGSVGLWYGFPHDGQPQDLVKAQAWYKKGCDGGDKDDCKSLNEIEVGDWAQVVTLEDLVTNPKKYAGKQVILQRVAVERMSLASGKVFPRGGSSIADGISAVVADNEDVRRTWTRLRPFRGQLVKELTANVEEEMSRTGGVRLRVLDVTVD